MGCSCARPPGAAGEEVVEAVAATKEEGDGAGAPLTVYFSRGYLDGELYAGPGYSPAVDVETCQRVLEHGRSGLRVWGEALDLRAEAPDDPIVVLYYYTGRTGFMRIACQTALDRAHYAALSATLRDKGWRGAFLTQREPETLVDGRPPPASGPWAAQEEAIFCIPILAPQSCARSLADGPTPIGSGRPGPLGGGGLKQEPPPGAGDAWVLQLPAVPGSSLSRAASEARLERARKRVRWLEATQGRAHPDTVACAGELAVLLQRAGKLKEAEGYWRRHLQACEGALGPGSPAALDALAGLAGLLASAGSLKEAEACHRRALQAREQALGPEDASTLASTNSLATLLQSTGRLEEAEQLFRRGLQLAESSRGAAGPEALLFAGNLATLLMAKGCLAEAEPLCLRVLQGRAEALGPAHPDTLTAANELALLLQRQERFAEAEAHLRRTLRTQEETLGALHPDALISANNLAFLLQAASRPEEAEPLHRRVLQACEEALGAKHPDTLAACGCLGSLLFRDLARHEEAEPLLRRAFEGLQACLGPSHARARKARHSLAELLKGSGRRSEARSLRTSSVSKESSGLHTI